MERSRFEEACRTGAPSRQDCASGVARRPPGAPASARVRLIPSRQQLRVPVSALLARDGGTFWLESVSAVTPLLLPSPGNGDSQLLFRVAGDAFNSSGFGWRLHPILGPPLQRWYEASLELASSLQLKGWNGGTSWWSKPTLGR